MREIALDTETTGMDPFDGHRLVEIGAVELENHMPTGRHYHQYINPERDIPSEVVAIHGIDNKKVENEPVFGEIIGDFLDFIGETSILVIHNAAFDLKFLNFQLKEFGFPEIDPARVVDTLDVARRKFPGSPANLDALCRRFDIDNTQRTLHGALLDSELLAEVYLELLGGRQRGLSLEQEQPTPPLPSHQTRKTGAHNSSIKREHRAARDFLPSETDLKAHRAMTQKLKNALWTKT